MLRAIHEARRSIRLEMYIYTASPIGEQFRDALTSASQRGVKVQVMVDSWGSMTLTERFWDPLRDAGGEFHWFNPLALGRCGIRNHRKLLVCDEEIAFVGGFNIASEYQGDGVNRGWHDLGLRVRGALARELAGTFDVLFKLSDFQHRRFTHLRKSAHRQILSTPDGQVILNGPGRAYHFLNGSLLNDLHKAKEIRIISAYFLPTRPIRRALIQAARRKARVQLILAGKSDVPISQLAARRFYQALLRAGIEIYEYQPQILHAKLFLLDDVVYVGSANLDRRSFHINYELMLRIPDAGLAEQAQATFAHDLTLSQRIHPETWRAERTFWSKLKEQWAFFLLARVDTFIARHQLRTLHLHWKNFAEDQPRLRRLTTSAS
jgi:cardiolipin synthase